MTWRIYILCLIFGLAANNLLADDEYDSHENIPNPQSVNHFDENHWRELTNDLDYTVEEKIEEEEEEEIEEEKEEKKAARPPFEFAELWKTIFKIFVILSAIILAASILYFFISTNNRPKNNVIKRMQKDFSIEEIEENLQDADVESFLEQAIKNRDYTLAIRLYYLNCIKKLSENDYIKWKRDKTNRTYANELSSSPLSSAFGEITPIFERVWYGNRIINEQDFEILQPKFQHFINNIKPKPDDA